MSRPLEVDLHISVDASRDSYGQRLAGQKDIHGRNSLKFLFCAYYCGPFFDRLKNSVYFLMAVDGGFASFAGLLLICLLQVYDNGSIGCCRDLQH